MKLLVTGGAGYIGSVAAHQLVEAGVPRLVFSSTAAVYGELEQVPIAETAPALPTSPYGASKLAVNRMIRAALGWKGVHCARSRRRLHRRTQRGSTRTPSWSRAPRVAST